MQNKDKESFVPFAQPAYAAAVYSGAATRRDGMQEELYDSDKILHHLWSSSNEEIAWWK